MHVSHDAGGSPITDEPGFFLHVRRGMLNASGLDYAPQFSTHARIIAFNLFARGLIKRYGMAVIYLSS